MLSIGPDSCSKLVRVQCTKGRLARTLSTVLEFSSKLCQSAQDIELSMEFLSNFWKPVLYCRPLYAVLFARHFAQDFANKAPSGQYSFLLSSSILLMTCMSLNALVQLRRCE